MVPALAEEIRARGGGRLVAARLGAARSVAFVEQRRGVDVYDVTSEKGFARWRIGLAPDGKVETLRFQILEKPPAPPSDAERSAPPAGPGPPGDAERAAAIDARLALEGDGFSGVVLVARGGVPIYHKAVGLADREQARANTLGTRFRIASMTKMFTAVAVLQLVQAGKLRLGAPLGTYLTDYPNQDIAKNVTLHHLLTHTGGTGDVFGAELAARGGPRPSLQDYVALHGARAPRFAPGSRYEYSNYGFVLLGRVVERASGQSYYDYVAKHVFAPAGMTHSDFATIDESAEERAIGYTRYLAPEAPEAAPGAGEGAPLVPNTPMLRQRGTPAGGAWSTPGDLLSFANALEGHRLLDERHTVLLTTGKVPTQDGGRYAYGFSEGTLPGLRCVGHNGGSAGASARLRICQAPGEPSSQVVIVLSNLDPPAGMDLMRLIRAGFSRSSAEAKALGPSGADERDD